MRLHTILASLMLASCQAAPVAASSMHQGPHALVAYAELYTNGDQALLLDIFADKRECEAAKQTEIESGRVPLGVRLFCVPIKDNI